MMAEPEGGGERGGTAGGETEAAEPGPSRPPLDDADAALLETLPAELARRLFPEAGGAPLTLTLVYPQLAVPEAVRLEAAAHRHEISESSLEDEPPRHRTTFTLEQIEEFHQLYHLAEEAAGTAAVEVLINDRDLPLTRELWLPLVWILRD